MAEEIRSEQLNQKITPTARKKLDEVLKRMGHPADGDGHVKWDQDRLLEVLGVVESTLVLDEHENYAEVVTSPEAFEGAKEYFDNNKIEYDSAELDLVPSSYITLPEDKLSSFQKLVDSLEDNDDVQEVYHNVELPEVEEDEE